MDLGETITLKRKVDKDGNYYYTFSNLESEKIIFKTGGGGKEDEIKFKFSGVKEDDVSKDIICNINIDKENVDTNTPNYSSITITRDNYANISLYENYNCFITMKQLINGKLAIDTLKNYTGDYGLIIIGLINNKVLLGNISKSTIVNYVFNDSKMKLSDLENSQISIEGEVFENSKVFLKDETILENKTEKEIVEIIKNKNDYSLLYYLLNYYYLHEKKKPISQKEFLDAYAKNTLIFKK